MNRRNFLGWLGIGAATVATGGIAKAVESVKEACQKVDPPKRPMTTMSTFPMVAISGCITGGICTIYMGKDWESKIY